MFQVKILPKQCSAIGANYLGTFTLELIVNDCDQAYKDTNLKIVTLLYTIAIQDVGNYC